MIEIGIKLLNSNAIVPSKGTDGAAAFDLVVPTIQTVKHGRNVIKLGWAIELPEGFCAEIEPRSGYSAKGFADIDEARLDCDVIHGLIDEDYKGEVGVIVKNNDREFIIGAGQRIAQMIIHKIDRTSLVVVESLSQSDRDKGGFGSTGV